LKLGKENVFFNTGIDQHGQKVYEKALEEGFTDTQEFCDRAEKKWKEFCAELKINYDNFYCTTSPTHKKNAVRFYNEIKEHVFSKEYEGQYCVGCESFITQKEIVNGLCPIHHTPLVPTKETNKFFDLKKFAPLIKDILIDKSISPELANLLADPFDLSITRQNVKWGIDAGDGDVFYVWFEALLNYIFAIKYYEDREYFDKFWKNSLIICGKDNLKFQAYILQGLLLANNIPQTQEVLVHGTILDAEGNKLSKTNGNVIDPLDQVLKYGLDPLRYYLFFGLNTFGNSKYSEADLVSLWNADIVNGLGNLITRLLHLVDLKGVQLSESKVAADLRQINIEDIQHAFESSNFSDVRELLNETVNHCNKRITQEKPFDKNCPNPDQILNEIYFALKDILPYYGIILKDHSDRLAEAFIINKKAILFTRREAPKDSHN